MRTVLFLPISNIMKLWVQGQENIEGIHKVSRSYDDRQGKGDARHQMGEWYQVK